MNSLSTLMAPSLDAGWLPASHHASTPARSADGTLPTSFAVVPESWSVSKLPFSRDRLVIGIASILLFCAVRGALVSCRERYRSVHKSKIGRINGTHAHIIPNVGSNWFHNAIFHIEYVGSSRSYTLTAWIRTMLMMHTLRRWPSQWCSSYLGTGQHGFSTYSKPTQNIAMSAILLLRGRWGLQTIGIGRTRTVKSVNKLSMPAARYAAGTFPHDPSTVFWWL